MRDKQLLLRPVWPSDALRVVICALLLLLATPVIEQAHAEHCEHEACLVCLSAPGSVLPCDAAVAAQISHGTMASCQHAERPSVASRTDIRSRGPPQI